jgi:signal peptidase I
VRRGKYEARNNDSKANGTSGDELSFTKTVLLYLHDLVYLLSVILLVLLLLFRVVVVSGSSMVPTLVDGDYLLLLSTPLYNSPAYGDIIVASKDSFREGEPIIKRVIATEGQTVDIDFASGTVYVDGVALDEPYINNLTTLDEGTKLPLVVEEGCVFVLGDNRGRSEDSRSPAIGQIDKREILGKALFLFLPGMGEQMNVRDFGRIGGIR